MKQSKIIGLTGGIATGKSTVVEILENRGYVVVDSDQIAHDVLNREEVIVPITEVFGEEILFEEKIQRQKLGTQVFASQEKLEILESIVYPYILSELDEITKKLAQREPVVFIDIPLLFEKKEILNVSFDEIWLVYATEDEQLKRMVQNRNMTLNEAQNRLKAQIPIKLKKNMADIIIWNNGTLGELENQVVRALRRLEAEK